MGRGEQKSGGRADHHDERRRCEDRCCAPYRGIVDDDRVRIIPRRIGWPEIGREPAGRHEPDADLVAPVGRAAAKVEHGPVIGEVGGDRVERAKPAPDAEDRLFDLILVGAEQAIPENEDAAVVLVEILVVDPVMDAMVRGRGEHAIEPAELADKLGMNPELVQEVDQADRDEHDRRNAGDRHRQVKDPAEQDARTRLPQGRREIEGFALVMDDMGGPEDADLMVDAVVPVVEEVVGDQRPDPDSPVVRSKSKQRKVIVDKDVDSDAQDQHEDAGNLTQDAGRKRPDRVIEPIDVASQREGDSELRRHQGDEHRNGVDDDVQAAPPTGALLQSASPHINACRPPNTPTADTSADTATIRPRYQPLSR